MPPTPGGCVTACCRVFGKSGIRLFLACWHDLVHIEQMTRILTEKRL
jgi:hypothetical protein